MQIYWLAVSVAWGTTKLLWTRAGSHIPPDERQDAWSFGQMLPILLLAAPIWSLIGAFAFGDRSERPQSLSHAQENVLIPTAAAVVPSTYEATCAQSVADLRGTTDHRFDPVLPSSTRHYISHQWTGACLTFPCLVILGVTIAHFIYVGFISYSLSIFWVTDGGIYLFALAFPLALQCTILLGVVFEEGFLQDRSAASRSKACCALLWLTFLIIWGFFIVLWVFFFSGFRRRFHAIAIFAYVRYASPVAGAAVLHLVYASGYFLQAFRKRPRLGCSSEIC